MGKQSYIGHLGLCSQIIALLLPDLPTIHCVHTASNQKLDAEKAQGMRV